MIKAFVFASLALLAACATSQPQGLPPPPLPERAGVDPLVAARSEGVRFMAHGSAPMFHLRFYDDRITFSEDGATWQTFPRPEAIHPRWYGEIYTSSNGAHELRIEVRRDRRCETQPGYVVVGVQLDGATLDGCGRDV